MTEHPRIANSRQIPSLFELMADRIPDVVWATDTDLRFTASFGSGLAALGLHPSEVIGKTLFDYFQTDDEAFPPLAAHGRALQGEAVDFEQVWQDRIFRCHLEQLSDGNGNVVGCLGFAQDITELKQIQEALGQSFEELRTIYECMVDGLLIADIQTKGFVKANPAICQMLGYSPEELLSMSVMDIHPKENHPTVLAAFQSQAEGQMFRADSLPVRRKDGSVFCADITANLIVYQGRPCLIGFFRDVTERQRAEEQLQVGLRTQNAISSLLRTTLESASLDEQFERILVSLFSIPWLALQAKGAIFVLDDNLNELVIRCQQGLPQELVIRCGRLPLGRCLCGRAASTRELLFADCVDARHETHYPGMLPHGHYCVPIISGDRVLGVLTLYLEEGHQTNPDEQAFLSTVADVLAALIVRERLERSLRERDMELLGAKKIQETLLPTSPPNVPGFDIAGRCFPAEAAAGDHFDYLWLPDGSLLVALADVAGHGFGPAIVAADFCAG